MSLMLSTVAELVVLVAMLTGLVVKRSRPAHELRPLRVRTRS